jgi:hypothetical protein
VQLWQLPEERLLILEAAQVEHQCALDDASDDGTGSARKAAAIAVSARPSPRPRAVGRIDTPALGSRSDGRAPLPTWLSHSIAPAV